MSDIVNLAEELSERMGIKKFIAREILDTLVLLIEERLSSMDEVSIRGLGKFSMVERSSKKARDIKGNREIILPPQYEPRFKLSLTFKRRLRIPVEEGKRILASRPQRPVLPKRGRGRPRMIKRP
jgi:nucleoid DNA-binding protein